jgi:hypothetical protein
MFSRPLQVGRIKSGAMDVVPRMVKNRAIGEPESTKLRKTAVRRFGNHTECEEIGSGKLQFFILDDRRDVFLDHRTFYLRHLMTEDIVENHGA